MLLVAIVTGIVGVISDPTAKLVIGCLGGIGGLLYLTYGAKDHWNDFKLRRERRREAREARSDS